MSIEEQRYQVTQILAECRVKGLPLIAATMAVAGFFVKHGIRPPADLLAWLGMPPAGRTLH